jgi:ornithine decarboxylase
MLAHDYSAPVLVIDIDTVTARYETMTAELPGVIIHYAMKCNPFIPVLTRLHSLGCHFEIASTTELQKLASIGVNPKDVLFSNPVKPVSHIVTAYMAGVRQFAFDSMEELTKLAELAPRSSVIVRLGVRDIHSEVPSEGKFGVDPDAAANLLISARDLGLHPLGVAFHVGSQMLDPQAWHTPLEQIAGIMDKLSAENLQIDMVNIGGGFPARYDTEPPPLAEYWRFISRGLACFPYSVQVVAEPGRALVAEAGTLIANVIGTATRFGNRWTHLDVGAFNGFTESLETNYQLRFPVGDSRDAPVKELCHLTGPTCDSQDTILFDVELSEGLCAGDQVYLGSTGAYTTVYASSFNGFGPPPVRLAPKRSLCG